MNFNALIPKPTSVIPTGATFTLSPATSLWVEPADAPLVALANDLAGRLRSATGFAFAVNATNGAPPRGNFYLTTRNADAALGDEGYELRIQPDGVTLHAAKPAGIFYGNQTLRQLFPPAIENASVQAGPWALPTGILRDVPRFAWRGAMLDVARHFFAPADVKHYLDLLALYKLNRLHLHLTDDQGWRIEVKSWGKLAAVGGSTQVGGGKGGYYTQDEYAALVAYAAKQFITLVPEIDMPGHTNAALASYAELNCDDAARALYTGTEVGFSSLCVDREITYKFVGDVVRELAALTPGPYLHIGGDETQATSESDFKTFIERVQDIVHANGKHTIGWEEIAKAKLPPDAIVQHWIPGSELARQAVQAGAKVIMSPASKTYLDMKYDESTPLGLHWAGYINVQTAYEWDPAAQVPGVSEREILGVEAPLWTETIESRADIESMAFPRLAAIAEIGWSPQNGRAWDEFVRRAAAHGARWDVMGVNYYRSPQIPWD